MSRAGTRRKGKKEKKDEKKILSAEYVDEIRQAFEQFDTNGTGMIDPKELQAAIISLELDKKNPAVYELIENLGSSGEGNSGVDFNTFIDCINSKLTDKDARERFEELFKLFTGGSKQKTITIDSLRDIVSELGKDISDEELNEIINENILIFLLDILRFL